MRAKSRRSFSRAYRYFFGLLSGLGISVVFVTVMSFTITLRVEKLAPVFLPILAGFIAFSALLYNRARAYPDGKIQRRSLYAADVAMWATVLYLLALMVGGIVTTFAVTSDRQGVSEEFTMESMANYKLLAAYYIPMLLAGLSFVSFSDALRIYCRGFFPFARLRSRLRQMKKPKS